MIPPYQLAQDLVSQQYLQARCLAIYSARVVSHNCSVSIDSRLTILVYSLCAYLSRSIYTATIVADVLLARRLSSGVGRNE